MKKQSIIYFSRLMHFAFATALLTLMLSFSSSRYNADGDWTLITEQNGISVYAMESACGKSELYLFKLMNTSSEDLSVKYTLTATRDVTIPPINKEVQIQAKHALIGTCETLWETALPNQHKGQGDLKNRVNVNLIVNQ